MNKMLPLKKTVYLFISRHFGEVRCHHPPGLQDDSALARLASVELVAQLKCPEGDDRVVLGKWCLNGQRWKRKPQVSELSANDTGFKPWSP